LEVIKVPYLLGTWIMFFLGQSVFKIDTGIFAMLYAYMVDIYMHIMGQTLHSKIYKKNFLFKWAVTGVELKTT